MFDKRRLKGIGQRIRDQREDKDFTQGVLGEKVGLTKSAISKIEKGDQIPSIEQLADIANALEIRLEYILGLDNIPDAATEHLISGIGLFEEICTTKAHTIKSKEIFDSEDFVFQTDKEYLMLTGSKKLFTLIREIVKTEIAKTELTKYEYTRRIIAAKKRFEQSNSKSTKQNESYFLITGEQMTEIIESAVSCRSYVETLFRELGITTPLDGQPLPQLE